MEKNYFTSEEILAKAKALGLQLAERKLKYYVTLGILPRPLRNPPDSVEKLDGRIAYFPADTVERLKKIKELQDSGFTLPQIKSYFNRSIDPQLQGFLDEKKVVSGNVLSPGALARVLLSDELRQKALSFHDRISRDSSEEAFQGAALDYYFDVLASLLGEEKAQKYVKELMLEASPEEREKKMAPLRRWKDYLLRKKSSRGIFLSLPLDTLLDRLQKGDFKEPEVMEKLRDMAEKVNIMQNRYREKGKSLSEAFELSRYMRQIFWIYLKALLEIEDYVKNRKKEHLKQARLLYHKADEMLQAVEDLIGVMKKMMKLHEDLEKM